MIITALLIVVLLVSLVSLSIVRPKNFPPGPTWLPITGNTWEVKRLSKKFGGLHLALLELSKRYNTNVLGLKLGSEYVVTVFKYPVVKAVLSSEDFDPRPTNFFIKLRCLGSIKGITCTNGETWSTQRNFMIKTLRNLGIGKKSTEEQIQEEIKYIIEHLAQKCETKIGDLVALAVVSLLWSFITGKRFCKEDERLSKLLELFEARAKLFDMAGGLLSQYPWLRYVAPNRTGYSLIQHINKDLNDLFMEPIEEHLRTWTVETEGTDFIYAFISEMRKKDAHYSFTNDNLLMACLDLFIAGSRTTSGTLDIAFTIMLQHQDVQLKIQKLLDEGMDSHQAVSYSDRHRFPYIEAVLLEILRYRSVAPLAGPRTVLQDTNLENFIIPKNTTVLIHTHSVHMDTLPWNDPGVFRPERFLSAENKLINYDEMLPFGFGKRRCIGDSLAKSCIFIFFTEILRNYTVVKNNSEIGKPVPGLTLSMDYSATFIKRK